LSERTEINVAANAANANLNAIVNEAFAVHTRTRAALVDKVYGALLDDASSNTTQNVVPRLALENNTVDFVLVQKLTEQEARRPGTYNGDLSAHD
jgi:hypothetical protein